MATLSGLGTVLPEPSEGVGVRPVGAFMLCEKFSARRGINILSRHIVPQFCQIITL